MKLSFSSNQKDHYTRGRSSALGRARSQLSQAVNGVLSGGLEALGERLQSSIRIPTTAMFRSRTEPLNASLAQMGAAAQAHAHRLREVIERDRALVETSPLEQGGPRTEPADAGEAPSEPAPAIADQAAALTAPSAAEPAQDVAQPPVEALDEPAGAPPGHESAAPPAIAAALADVPFVASAARVAPPAPQHCKEPIRTRTMAQLLARQGHRQRALSIYDFLLAAEPEDSSLRAEADALRASE